MAGSRRLLVLALDAASPDLVKRWASDGTLPHIGRLLARGVQAPTRSVEGLFVGGTWPSFFTGRDPGGHGIYWLDRILPASYRRQTAGPAELGRYDALWDVLGDAGRRCAVLDVPLAPLSSNVRGSQVVEWGVHDAVFGFGASPGRLVAEIERRHGHHPAPRRCDARRSPDEARQFADTLVRGAAARSTLTRDLLGLGGNRAPDDAPDDERVWDFAIQVFSETHCAGHQLWHTHDPAHPAHDPATQDAHGDLVRNVYVAVDRAVGDIVEAAGPDTTVALMTLHGMGPAGGGSLLLSQILRRLGVESPSVPAGRGTRETGEASRSSSPPLLRSLYHRLPSQIRTPIHRWRQRGNQAIGRGSPIDIDPAGTRAFHEGLGLGAPWSAIRLNVRGREPAGTLPSGAEAARFVAGLVRDLHALVDPRTGGPLVRRVVRREKLYTGPHVDELPDLLLEWDMTTPRGTTAAGDGRDALWEAESPRVGRVGATNRYCRTGEHRPEGMVVLAGPGIRAGEVGRTLSVVDLAPTFAAMLGCDAPSMTGSPVTELIEASGTVSDVG